jgi:hypothetical protein
MILLFRSMGKNDLEWLAFVPLWLLLSVQFLLSSRKGPTLHIVLTLIFRNLMEVLTVRFVDSNSRAILKILPDALAS